MLGRVPDAPGRPAFLLAAPSVPSRASLARRRARALVREQPRALAARDDGRPPGVRRPDGDVGTRSVRLARHRIGEVIHAAVPIVAHPAPHPKTHCYHCLRELRARARRLADARRRRWGRGHPAGTPARRRRGTRTTSWKRPRGTRSRAARRVRGGWADFHSPPRASRSPPRRARRLARGGRAGARQLPGVAPGTGSRSTPCCASRCCAAWPWPSWARAGRARDLAFRVFRDGARKRKE